ncbi:hypothetical protein ACLKMY_24115 [Paraburkholderia mimosarum]|uniref:hypothetical protein n=1 Tax=Paraburkholderia mimosarum TaxID=312026 RepID=UPI0039C1FCAF
MASHLLSQFPQDEQDDFALVCRRAVSEFEVVDEDQYPSGGRAGPIARQVTVALRGKSAVALYDGRTRKRLDCGLRERFEVGIIRLSQ